MLINQEQVSEVGLRNDVRSLNLKGERLRVVTALVKNLRSFCFEQA